VRLGPGPDDVNKPLPDWLAPERLWPPASAHVVRRLEAGATALREEALIEEVPVALVYNGHGHAVMLVTPGDLVDFAVGFGIAEGVIAQPADLLDFEIVEREDGIAIYMQISPQLAARIGPARSLPGRSGCGLCGVESIAQATRPPPPVSCRPRLTHAAVARAIAELPLRQPLFAATGGAHAAALVDTSGALLLVREDVGRHNALDKLIGAALRGRMELASTFVLVTSRASYELVHKTATAGIGCLVAVSAPTAHAVRLAEQSGVALAGFARNGRIALYAYPEAFDLEGSTPPTDQP